MSVTGYNQVAFLYASEQRRRVLFCLSKAPSRPGDLAERATTSRKTAHQALSGFNDRGWVTVEVGDEPEQDRSGPRRPRYALTASGELIVQMLQLETSPESELDNNVIAYLTGSEHRPQLLRLLRERPQRVPDLVATKEVSRTESRLYQTMNEFVDHDWVHQPKGDGTYALTVPGRDALEQFETLTESVGWVAEHASAINRLGEIGSAIPVDELARDQMRTTVLTATPGDPDTVLNYYSKQITEHDLSYLRGIAPIVSSLSNQIHRPLVENDQTQIELVVDEAVIDAARSSYSDMLEAAITAEDFEIYVYPERLRFGLVILDEGRRTLISGHDKLGVAQVCIDCVSESVIEWAFKLFDTYRENATPLSDY